MNLTLLNGIPKEMRLALLDIVTVIVMTFRGTNSCFRIKYNKTYITAF